MSDYLIHYAKGEESDKHKYLSRHMKDGKWVYVYADKNTHQDIEKNLVRVEAHENLQKRAQKIKEKNLDTYTGLLNTGRVDVTSDMAQEVIQKYRKAVADESYHEKAVSEYTRRAYESIENNSVSSLAQNTIANGKKLISSLFKK